MTRRREEEDVHVIRALIAAGLALIGNAFGLLVAAAVLDDMEITGAAFVLAVVIFTIVEVVIQPLLIQLAAKSASALRGATALVATLVSLVVTSLVSDGLTITGASTWLWATLIVWFASMIAGIILPLIFLRNRVEERRS
jgi:uncharacterized membrane protein YvlD (DUF360 family)